MSLFLITVSYSNTGGQASKSTRLVAVAKFAASGKRVREKDLGHDAMSLWLCCTFTGCYGIEPVAILESFREAEAYPGPSVDHCLFNLYQPRAASGMDKSQDQPGQGRSGWIWANYRYNPALEWKARIRSSLIQRTRLLKFQDSSVGSTLYLTDESFPAQAAELFEAAEENAKRRYNSYKRTGRNGLHQVIRTEIIKSRVRFEDPAFFL
jgi:pyruvate-ferredoxin/flavodoxin oxidoreductase